MKRESLPLREISIEKLCNGADVSTYEVPIYQRNYAWEKDEIATFIQDVHDAYKKNPKGVYYIGTLVTYHKGDQVYEVIDGQQRLTTIHIILGALGRSIQNKLAYRARKKSNDTIQSIPHFNVDEKDMGIVNGFQYAQTSINEIVSKAEKEEFTKYFMEQVHIIHYQVPKDIDLNHYFEIMNSRGEQLEKHEIIKARLISVLNEGTTEKDKEQSRRDRTKFNYIWENCCDMNVYVQQKSQNKSIFGKKMCDFVAESFDQIEMTEDVVQKQGISIESLIENNGAGANAGKEKEEDKPDTFQPIINFANFLLIVLKLTRILEEKDFKPASFNLDDKELINEFDQVSLSAEWVKKFGYNLIRDKFYLDNYMVHHSNEEDSVESNPWMLRKWQKENDKKGYLRNLAGTDDTQKKLVQLLSMFEVSFTARQRKNYLFYCLLYLFQAESLDIDIDKYCDFVEKLAEKYFKDVYLDRKSLNEINTPAPHSFDHAILADGKPVVSISNMENNFEQIYGDGMEKSKGIPLFVFNYLDYRIWLLYVKELRGERHKMGSRERREFFDILGCGDFGLSVFDMFYFSRTRRSLEHYFPQANAADEGGLLNEHQINCLGNYAMIGSGVNSVGSNWSPKAKRIQYLDSSGKIRRVSVASLKFMIMMQMCRENEEIRESGKEWTFEDIRKHQDRMIDILFGNIDLNFK